MPTISVAIITKNEGNRIRRCLECIQWVDEIVVVDSGSTDDTLSVCREFTEKVIVREFDNFANQKNVALELATGDWILSLDADEVVSSELAQEIRARINDVAVPYVAYIVRRENHVCGRPIHHVLQNDIQFKLFRSGRCRFRGRVHEDVDVDGAVGTLEHPLLHYNSATLGEFIRKNEMYAALQATDKFQHGRRFNLLKLVLSPLRTTWFRYVRAGGYKDGRIGLLVSLVLGYSAFRFHLKLWELRKGASRGLERADT